MSGGDDKSLPVFGRRAKPLSVVEMTEMIVHVGLFEQGMLTIDTSIEEPCF